MRDPRRPQRVVHVANRSGGFLLPSLIGRLQAEGLDVALVSLRQEPAEEVAFLADRDVVLHSLGASSRRGYPLALWRLVRLLRKLRPDIVHTHEFDATMLGLAAALLAGVSHRVVTRHYSDWHHLAGSRVHVALDRAANRIADVVVANSLETARVLTEQERTPTDKVRTIYLGFTPRPRSEPTDLPPGRDGRTIIVPGRLCKEKGQAFALRAIAALAARGLDPVVLLVGGGPDHDRLAALADELGLGASVRLLGHRLDVEEVMRRGDVVLVPSLNEPYGRTAMEAMGLGRATIASRVGGLAELVGDDEGGLLVPPGDVDALTSALERVLGDEALRHRLEETGRARVQDRFSEDRTVAQHLELYAALEPGRACPLCAAPLGASPSWSRAVIFGGLTFRYRRCTSCRSLACDPAPDEAMLHDMYGPAYALAPGSSFDIPDPRSDAWIVVEAIAAGGLFVDYGCGSGGLLERVRARGGEVLGVELDAGTVAAARARTGLTVVTPSELTPWHGEAATVHLGDVVEHLSDPIAQLAPALALLRPGGCLLAQGPLEANRSVFHVALRITGWLRRRRPTTNPPYHVLLATEQGQRMLFARLGLEEQSWHVTEEAWPAPDRLHRADLAQPRAVGLFAVRKVSQAFAHVAPGAWGNRYRYRGARPAVND